MHRALFFSNQWGTTASCRRKETLVNGGDIFTVTLLCSEIKTLSGEKNVMRKIFFPLIALLLWPDVGYSRHHWGYPAYSPTPHAHYGLPKYHRPHQYRSHRDNWVVSLDLAGGVIGIVALSQLTWPSTPPPPQHQARLCRDTYNYYDEFGNYLSTRFIDRPCF